MAGVLFDTSVYIAAVRQGQATVFTLRRAVRKQGEPSRPLWLSAVVLEELYVGAQPTLLLNNLQKLPARRRSKLVKLLTNDPVKRFLVSVDEKQCRFRIAEPGVREMAAA